MVLGLRGSKAGEGTMRKGAIQLHHGALGYWAGGEGKGLLLLHCAYGDAAFSWSPIWDKLSSSYRVLAPDLPGFGESAPLADPSPATVAATLDALLDEQGVSEAVVVGNSFGMFLALQLAERYPRRVTKLVLSNGIDFPVMPALARRIFHLSGPRRALSWMWGRTVMSAAQLVRPSFSPRSGLPPQFLDQITKDPRAHAHATAVIGVWLGHTKPTAPPTVPVCLIWGTDDKALPLARARQLAEWAPRAVVRPIERAGHMPQVEQPEEFLKALGDFLA